MPLLNNYQNRVSVQLEAKAARLADPRVRLNPGQDEWEAMLHAFLTQALYNEVFPAGQAGSMAQLVAALRSSPRGQLVLLADPAGALALWDALSAQQAPMPDVYAGRFPDDRRCWNALCLLPQGKIPQGYHSIWCLGAPGWLLAPGRPARELGTRAPWLGELPGTDQLRRLYLAARQALSAPWKGRSTLVFCRALGEAAGLSPAGCLAGMLVLNQLDLLSFAAVPPSAAMRPFKKASPQESVLYQKLTLLRGWEVNADGTA